MTDYDDLAAEFYDISALGSGWPLELGVPADARHAFRTDAGPLIDLGAGSGLSAVALADAFPGADVLAVEPSRAMRAVLTSRVLGRDDLRERVTIVPGDVQSALLPPVWGGLTARGLVGHIDPDQRTTLWHRLAERLALGAAALVDQVAECAPEPGRREIYRTETTVGRYGYQVVIHVDVSRSGAAKNAIRVSVTDRTSGEPVAEHRYERELFVVTRADLEAELAAEGLTARAVSHGCLLVARTSP